ncbi:DUF3300 domain-containing protein [Rhizobium sp. TRM96647]|uniref:DUF3300 domain-containing protein n=1 Tax=unclassified Rhizobium TaxID=2613769 RepID=UPI0021E8560C|nr:MULTISPECIES: DUF3300 domain-containing protein [unclassified Rhizobium]MCV3738786.1 DUF3300 domain-containing protein [Rhizobium sp. TRM96647]MCV3760507.1 DUF3300 domain-containing protein [Rhizobium sp. TRM96650]
MGADRFSCQLRSGLAVALLLGLAGGFQPAGRALAQEQTAAASAATGQDGDEQPDLLTEDELEVLVARVALYPDELVALVSSASLYPLQVVEAERFLQQKAKDKDLQPKDSWDSSIISLLNYPDIVKMMSEDLDWTQALGSALAYQQKDVLMAIQTLRDKAVADGVIKTDDKVQIVNQGDNVVIQPADPEKVYVPRYEPEMLYEPGYVPAPITYYDDPYPSYYYPSAPYFAAAITGGAIWAATVDWDDWGVWGGRWDGDVDIDCDKCFNDIDIDRDKFKMNDVDWKNVDRSKIKFDKNQFANVDRDRLKNEFKGNRDNNIANRAKDVRRNGDGRIANRGGKISVDDVRKSKVDADRARQRAGNIDRGNIDRGGQAAAARRDGGNVANRAGGSAAAKKVTGAKSQNINRKANKPRPGGQAQKRSGGKPSALGKVGNGKKTQFASQRGRQSMSGGGGHRRPQASGGRRGGGGGHHGGGRSRGGGGGHRR